jgi:hypothetical protein
LPSAQIRFNPVSCRPPTTAAAFTRQTQQPNPTMKAQDAKKEKKKLPQKSLKEKRAAKAEKKKNK